VIEPSAVSTFNEKILRIRMGLILDDLLKLDLAYPDALHFFQEIDLGQVGDHVAWKNLAIRRSINARRPGGKAGSRQIDLSLLVGKSPPHDLHLAWELKFIRYLAQATERIKEETSTHKAGLFQEAWYMVCGGEISVTRMGILMINARFQRLVFTSNRIITIELPLGHTLVGQTLTPDQLNDADIWGLGQVPHQLIMGNDDSANCLFGFLELAILRASTLPRYQPNPCSPAPFVDALNLDAIGDDNAVRLHQLSRRFAKKRQYGSKSGSTPTETTSTSSSAPHGPQSSGVDPRNAPPRAQARSEPYPTRQRERERVQGRAPHEVRQPVSVSLVTYPNKDHSFLTTQSRKQPKRPPLFPCLTRKRQSDTNSPGGINLPSSPLQVPPCFPPPTTMMRWMDLQPTMRSLALGSASCSSIRIGWTRSLRLLPGDRSR